MLMIFLRSRVFNMRCTVIHLIVFLMVKLQQASCDQLEHINISLSYSDDVDRYALQNVTNFKLITSS